MVKPDDRMAISADLLEATAARVAKVLADPAAWGEQQRKAIALASRISRGYDAAGRFREAVETWL
jgi:hypothetical protein